MAKQRDFSAGDTLPASYLDSENEYSGTFTSNLRLTLDAGNTVQIVAGAGSAQVAVGIAGLWRFISATLGPITHPAVGARVSDVLLVASANDFGSGDTDNTDYTFGLQIVASGGAATGNHNGEPVVASRKIAELDWDGAAITGLRQLVGLDTVAHQGNMQSPRTGLHSAFFRDSTGKNRFKIAEDGAWEIGDAAGAFAGVGMFRSSGALRTAVALNSEDKITANFADTATTVVSIGATPNGNGLYIGGDIELYRLSSGIGKLTGALQATGSITASVGGLSAGIGAIGPSGAAGLLLNADTTLYRLSAGVLRTDTALSVGTSVAVATTLAVTGVSTLTGGIALASAASIIFNGDTTLNRNGTNSLQTLGAFTVGGLLTVTGAVTIGTTLGVTGATTHAGAVSITAAGTGLAVANNVTVGGTLAVTGIASGPTAAPGTNTTQLATTAFVTAAVAGVTGGTGGIAFLGNTQAFTAINTFQDTTNFTKAAGTGIAVTANATIGGTLGVTGLVTATAGFKVPALVGISYFANQANAQIVLQNNLLAADANLAFAIYGSGQHVWGAGGATPVDLLMKRESAGLLVVRNGADSAYANLKVNDFTALGAVAISGAVTATSASFSGAVSAGTTLSVTGTLTAVASFAHQGTTLGFYNTTPVAKRTGYGAGSEITTIGLKQALSATSNLGDVIRVLSSLVTDHRNMGLIGS